MFFKQITFEFERQIGRKDIQFCAVIRFADDLQASNSGARANTRGASQEPSAAEELSLPRHLSTEHRQIGLMEGLINGPHFIPDVHYQGSWHDDREPISEIERAHSCLSSWPQPNQRPGRRQRADIGLWDSVRQVGVLSMFELERQIGIPASASEATEYGGRTSPDRFPAQVHDQEPNAQQSSADDTSATFGILTFSDSVLFESLYNTHPFAAAAFLRAFIACSFVLLAFHAHSALTWPRKPSVAYSLVVVCSYCTLLRD